MVSDLEALQNGILYVIRILIPLLSIVVLARAFQMCIRDRHGRQWRMSAKH